VFDWQGTNIFTNFIQKSRPLSAFEDPAEIPAIIPSDANGNLTARFGMVVKAPLRDGDAGEYRIRFKGKATVTALPNAISVQNQRTEGPAHFPNLGDGFFAGTLGRCVDQYLECRIGTI